jgi:hypothetical protein
MTWLAADCGGALSIAKPIQCDTTSEDSASDFLGLLVLQRWLCVRFEAIR